MNTFIPTIEHFDLMIEKFIRFNKFIIIEHIYITIEQIYMITIYKSITNKLIHIMIEHIYITNKNINKNDWTNL